jgi:integrase/recombinase XerD
MAEMSPLRRRMIEDMTIRNLSPATQRSYLHAVSRFSQYFGRSPDRLGLEDVRAYQVHLASKGVAWRNAVAQRRDLRTRAAVLTGTAIRVADHAVIPVASEKRGPRRSPV